MRERETKISEAAVLLERAERLATNDPAAALPVAREALQVCQDVGVVSCLESLGHSVLSWILAKLGRLDESENALQNAYRLDCPSCRPVIDRRATVLLNEQGRQSEAVKRASRAVATAKGLEKGRALVALGVARFYAGDVSGAVEALTEALTIIPVRSPHHAIALANLASVLGHTENPEDVERAVAELEGLPDRFKGLKRVSLARIKPVYGDVIGAWVRATESLADRVVRDRH